MIRFTAAPAEPWCTLAFLALLLVAAWAYRRARLPRVTRLALIGLRAALLMLALAAVFQPVRESVSPERGAERLVVLQDVSASMALPGADGRARSAAARATAERLARAWKERNGGAGRELLCFTFAETCRAVDDFSTATETGALADLAGALTAVEGACGGRPPAGLLLITDGRSNAGGPVFAAADRLQCPIFPIPPGPGEAGARWLRAEAPAAVAAGNAVVFRGEVAGREPITLTLSEVTASGERRITEQSVSAGPVSITAPARGAGAFTYRLRLAGADSPAAGPGAIAAEATDNTRTFLVQVPAARDLLLLAGRLSWEYKYLRQSLLRMGAPPVHVVAFDENRAVYTAGRGRDFARPRQWRPEQLGRLAALVVVDATPEALPAPAVEAVRAAVSEGSLGLAVAGDLEGSPLLPLIPATLAPAASANLESLQCLRPGHPLAPAINAMKVDGPRVAFTPTAAGQALAGLVADRQVMVEGRLGLGRVIAVGFGAWRTAWNGGEPRAVERFWQDLARYLAPPPRPQLTVRAPRTAVMPGEEVTLEIEADSAITGFLARAEGAGLSGPVEIDGRRLKARPRAEGECRITVQAADDPALSTTVWLASVRQAREYAVTDPDTTLLAALASRSGGAVLDEAADPSGLDRAVEAPSWLRRRVEPAWDLPALLLLIIALLVVEWTLRRRNGLL